MKAIVLTRGRIATVDDKDFDRVNQFKWHALKVGRRYYGARHIRHSDGKKGYQYLHNFVLGKKRVDHRDGDGLNNQQENLRAASKQQNNRAFCRKKVGATSRYRGVSWASRDRRWVARINVPAQVSLGNFLIEEDAARAYDFAARKHFGDFACPNFS